MNNNYVIFGLILVAILILIYKSMPNLKKENFYYFHPPSNCMENVFGKTNCYPPYYFPFYSGDFHYPYPLFFY